MTAAAPPTATAVGTAGAGTVLRLALRPPFAVAPLLAALSAHAVPGVERAEPEAARHTRTVPAPHGAAVVTVDLSEDHVDATVHAHPADEAEVVALVRRWLDLDADPAAVAAVMRDDPLLGPLVAARPGLRVLGHVDGFEAAAVTVLGQQVSLAAARTFAGRLVTAYGSSAPLGLRAFPRPAAIAAAAPEELRAAVGVTNARARTLVALAEACAGGLDVRPGQDPAGVRRRLLALPGIGPWTADYLALRALGDRDAFPATDLVLRRALGNPAPAAAVARAERWRPLRAYAVTHLWTAHAYV